ncbi:MAG: prenyltransferase [Actinomycetota bacterium]|nr:prenyltransferase [Actinomycetota bacterium]
MTLEAEELSATVDSIAGVQQPDGMIPWFSGGHGDPWNHVEAAMALDAGGRRAAAEAAYGWLAATQRPDGAWHQYYRGGRVEVATLDANVSAYVATGVWHHFLVTGDTGFLEAMWPVVDAAMSFVLGLQERRGEVIWARHGDGTPWTFALLTASSSTFASLRAALAVADRLGHERSAWGAALAALGRVIAEEPGAFLPKDRWSMDWYYPVLTGVVTGATARDRLAAGSRRFIMEGLGVRCVADKPWVTAAETSECAMAHLVAGEVDVARGLLDATRHLRHEDGSYFTGMVHPQGDHFPAGERATYSAAAVVLTAAALDGSGAPVPLLAAAQGISLVAPSPVKASRSERIHLDACRGPDRIAPVTG